MKKKLIWAALLSSLLLAVAFHFMRLPKKASGVTPPCVVNLKRLDHVKMMWIDQNRKDVSYVPSWEDIDSSLQFHTAEFYGFSNGRPLCPLGGRYTLESGEKWPKCSIGGPGHSLEGAIK